MKIKHTGHRDAINLNDQIKPQWKEFVCYP